MKASIRPARSCYLGWIRNPTPLSALISIEVMLVTTLLGLAALPLIGNTSVGMIYLLGLAAPQRAS